MSLPMNAMSAVIVIVSPSITPLATRSLASVEIRSKWARHASSEESHRVDVPAAHLAEEALEIN